VFIRVLGILYVYSHNPWLGVI